MRLKREQVDVFAQSPRQVGVEEVADLCEDWIALKTDQEEHDQSFDIRWKADMRAIKKWHEAGGDPMTWPDHADLCVWLMLRLVRTEEFAMHLLSVHESRDAATARQIVEQVQATATEAERAPGVPTVP